MAKKTFGCCGCKALSDSEVALNLHLDFVEALKLHRAIDEALSSISQKNRSLEPTGVNIAIFKDNRRINILESKCHGVK